MKNEDVKLLLAECYLGNISKVYKKFIGEGKAYKAYEILKDSSSN